MSGKTIDEIANTIWQRGYDAGRKAERDESSKHDEAEYERGRKDVLEELAQWLSPEAQEPDTDPVQESVTLKIQDAELSPGLQLALTRLRTNPGLTAWGTRKNGPGSRLYDLEKLGLARREGSKFYAVGS